MARAPARSRSSDRIEPYLTKPQVVKREDGSFDLDYDRPKSIGRLRGFQGNYGVFVRSYAYILSLGSDGLQEASETAVLNANYLLAKLRELGVTEHLPPAYDRLCMHEFVLSGAPMKRELGLRTLDLAKRLLDHGFHPPTVYFPLLVDEALLIEPTETETQRDARRRSPRRWRRSCARAPRTRRSPATRPTRRRSAVSTRPAPPSVRSSASRCRRERCRRVSSAPAAVLRRGEPRPDRPPRQRRQAFGRSRRGGALARGAAPSTPGDTEVPKWSVNLS